MSAGKAVTELFSAFLGAFEGMKSAGKSVGDLIGDATKGIDLDTAYAGSKVGTLRKVAQGFLGLNRGNDEIASRRFAGDVSKRLYGAVQSRNALASMIEADTGFKAANVNINKVLSQVAAGDTPTFLGGLKGEKFTEAVADYTGSLRNIGIKADLKNIGEVTNINTALANIGSSEDAMRTLGMNIKNAGISGQAGAMFGSQFVRGGKVAPVRGVMGMGLPMTGVALGTNLLSVPNKVLDVATEDAIRRGRI